MNHIELLKSLSKETPSKIIYFVMDGVGGLPTPDSELTELEAANTPNLDKLAYKSSLGLSIPIFPGITPGSGPGHLAIFGYDPLEHQIGRGALSAAGVGFQQGDDDIAARINFCTIDGNGNVTDRRAGRIATDICDNLCKKISETVKLDGVKFFIQAEKEHRAMVVFRGKGLSDKLTDTDPQKTGVPPKAVKAMEPEADKAAAVINDFLAKVKETLKEEHPANMMLLRGFASKPVIPQFQDVYKLKPLAVAVYPMYKGLAHLVGMNVLQGLNNLDDQMDALRKHWNDYDFFFVHFKYTDSRGEDGDFAKKVQMIEEADKYIPQLLDLNPDCLIVTGDHSTPAVMKSHSWHGVPFLLFSQYARRDKSEAFNESTCAKGSLGNFEAKYALSLAMAHAMKLEKFGA